jgi:serine/threonine-protein kinase SRK2
MEFVPGGDLFDYVLRKDGVPEDEARGFFQQIIVGVEYCHRMVCTAVGRQMEEKWCT